MDGTPVVVTTVYRGVFFGFLPPGADKLARSLTLENVRNAIYWAGSRGFLGLSSHGPSKGSRIGATAARVLLHDITSVAECTPEAAKVWSEWSE